MSIVNKIQTWKRLSGEKIENLTKEISSLSEEEKVIHVGCDSQENIFYTEFVTVVVILKPGKGGRVLYTREKVPTIESLRQRLLTEVSKSIDVALYIDNLLSEEIDLYVHVDANPKLKFKSSKYIKELVKYVVGQGFICLTKPDGWAATSVADHVIKSKNL